MKLKKVVGKKRRTISKESVDRECESCKELREIEEKLIEEIRTFVKRIRYLNVINNL